MQLSEFNNLNHADAVQTLLKVCNSLNWAKGLSAKRPFANFSTLARSATSVWNTLKISDYKDAFKGHPRIGGNKDKSHARKRSKWAKEESKGVLGASEATIRALQEENDAYYEKFGFVFLVCATGLSAKEMLDMLRIRAHNSVDDEIINAAAEEAKITQLRLKKLFPSDSETIQSSLSNL